MELADLLPEDLLRETLGLLVRLVEAAGALVILVGAVLALARFLSATLRPSRDDDFTSVRLGLGRHVALGLEFQLAGDVLSTALAPSLRQVAVLAAVAAVRTALNFVLAHELAREREEVAARRPADGAD